MEQRKFYFNRQLMSMCEICGQKKIVPVTENMFDHIQAFQKGVEGWVLGKDFVIIAGYAMRPGRLEQSE